MTERAKNRRNPKRCPTCRASYFHLEAGIVKPVFVCTTGCGDRWSWGRDGGEFFAYATNVAETRPSDWISQNPDDLLPDNWSFTP